MKLTRHDILALIVLAFGLLSACLSSNPGGRFAGSIVAGIGLVGCILSFLVD